MKNVNTVNYFKKIALK